MATQAGFNTTQADAAILASNISTYYVPTARANILYPLLGFLPDLRDNKSNLYDVPRWGAFPTIANQPAESDEFALANVPLTAKSVFTAVDPGAAQMVTDQVMQDMGAAGAPVLTSPSVMQMIEALRQYLDTAWLNLITSATNTSDHSGVNLTLALWQTDLAAFKAQKPLGETCFLGSNALIRDFLIDLQNSAGGVQLAGAGLEVFNNGGKADGYLGMYAGVRIFESSNVPQFDGANDSGGFITVQPGGGPGGETLSPLGLAVWQDIYAKGMEVPRRKGEEVTVSCRVGLQVVTNDWLRETVYKRAAA